MSERWLRRTKSAMGGVSTFKKRYDSGRVVQSKATDHTGGPSKVDWLPQGIIEGKGEEFDLATRKTNMRK